MKALKIVANTITHAECHTFLEVVQAWNGEPVTAAELSEYLFEDGAGDELARTHARLRVHAIGSKLVREGEVVRHIDGWTLPEWVGRTPRIRLPRVGTRAQVTLDEVEAVAALLSSGPASASEIGEVLYQPHPRDEGRASARATTVLNKMAKDGLVVHEQCRTSDWFLTRAGREAA